MKKVIFICFLLSAKLAFGQTNGGFEIWDSVYTALYAPQLDTSFGVPNPMAGALNSWTFDWSGSFGIFRTTDSYSGNYSLLLSNWYNGSYGNIYYNDTISYRPLYLHGYFKYITGGFNGLAQGTAKVILTRFNGTSNDTIGTGNYLFDSFLSMTG